MTSGGDQLTTDEACRAAVAAERLRLLLCVVPAMVVPLLGSLVYFVWLAGNDAAPVIYGATKLFTLVWPLIAVLLVEREHVRLRGIDWRKHFRAIPLGVVSGLLISALILGAYLLTPLGDYVRGFADAIRAKVVDLHVLDHYVAFAIFLAGAHSLIEEYYWRWYVFGRLARVIPLGWAGALASLAFAAHHYVLLGCYFSPLGMVLFGTGVGIGGALWCWLYRRQTTLVGAWVSHALVDAAILCIGYQLVFP